MIMTSYENSAGITQTEGTDWEEVQRRFLPSKDKRLLQYRQIQLISCEENSKFQRFNVLFLFLLDIKIIINNFFHFMFNSIDIVSLRWRIKYIVPKDGLVKKNLHS